MNTFNSGAGFWAQTEANYQQGGIAAAPTTPSVSVSIEDFRERRVFASDAGHWNQQLAAIEQLPEGLEKSSRLLSLWRNFLEKALAAAQLIYSERHLPAERRTVPPMEQGKDRFIFSGIVVQFPQDTEISPTCFLYGGAQSRPALAGKALENELRNSRFFRQAILDYNLPVQIAPPMSVIVELGGHKILCSAELPISARSIRFGSTDGKFVHIGTDAKLSDTMKILGSALNLSEQVVTKNLRRLTGPADIQIHQSEEDASGVFYMIHLRHSFPPEQPTGLPRFGTEIHHKMLRPEFVRNNEIALASNAFSGWLGLSEEARKANQQVVAATRRLYTEVIPMLAKKLVSMYKSPESLLPYSSFDISHFFHTNGVNLRMLGFVRKVCTLNSARRMLLTEMTARTFKAQANSLLSKLNPQQGRLQLLKLLNLLLKQPREGKFWIFLKQELDQYFIDPGYDEIESKTSMDFGEWVDTPFLVKRISSLMSLTIAREGLEATKLPLDSPILAHHLTVTPRIKDGGVIASATSDFLYYNARNNLFGFPSRTLALSQEIAQWGQHLPSSARHLHNIGANQLFKWMVGGQDRKILEAAFDNFQRSIKLNASNPGCLTDLAWALHYLDPKHLADIRRYRLAALRLHPSVESYLVQEALGHYTALRVAQKWEDLSMVLLRFHTILEHNPNNVEALVGRIALISQMIELDQLSQLNQILWNGSSTRICSQSIQQLVQDFDALLRLSDTHLSHLIRESLYPGHNNALKVPASHLGLVAASSSALALALRRQLDDFSQIRDSDWTCSILQRIRTGNDDAPKKPASTLHNIASVLTNLEQLHLCGSHLAMEQSEDSMQALADNLTQLISLTITGAADPYFQSQQLPLETLIVTNGGSLGYLKLEKCAALPAKIWAALDTCCLDSLALVDTDCTGLVESGVTLNQSLLSLRIDGDLGVGADDVLSYLFRSCTNDGLIELILGENHTIKKPTTVLMVIDNSPGLKLLRLGKLDISNDKLVSWAKSHSPLETLQLFSFPSLTTETMSGLLQNLPHLRSLTLEELPAVSHLTDLRACQNLQDLKLVNMTGLQPNSFSKGLPLSLCEVKFSPCLHQNWVADLSSLSRLTHVDIDKPQFAVDSAHFLKFMQQAAPHLISLRWTDLEIADNQVSALLHLSKLLFSSSLAKLDLTNSKISSSGFTALFANELPVQQLVLAGCKAIGPALSFLSAPQLRVLNIKDVLGEVSIQFLQAFPRLEELATSSQFCVALWNRFEHISLL